MEKVLKIGCVILASGQSVRFGSDKLMALFGGAPLIERAIQKAADVFRPVVVVTRSDAVARLAARYRDAGVTVVLHALPNQSDTIRLGVEAMPDMDGICLMVADQPLLTRWTLGEMCRFFRMDPSAIIRASFMGTPGNPAIFPKWLFSELAALPEDGCGRDVIAKHARYVCRAEAQHISELRDADTPDELAALERLLADNPDI